MNSAGGFLAPEKLITLGFKMIDLVSKTKKPLSKDTIQKALNELVKDKEKATTMTEHIINSRPTVERVNLKRTKNRGPKNK